MHQARRLAGRCAAAAEEAVALGKLMGATAFWTVLSRPLDETNSLVNNKPAFSPTYGVYDTRFPRRSR